MERKVRKEKKSMISIRYTSPGDSMRRLPRALLRIFSVALVHGCIAATQPGTLDTSFDPGQGANGQVLALAPQGDGKIFIAGRFNEFVGVHRKGIARLNEVGNLNTNFVPADLYSSWSGFHPPDPLALRSVVAQEDGKVVVAGNAAKPVNVFWPIGSARFNEDGSLDSSFNSNHDHDISNNPFGTVVALQSDGKLLATGWDAPYRLTPSCNLYRFNADGTVDTNFVGSYWGASQLSLPVPAVPHIDAIALQPGGKIIIGGLFTEIVRIPLEERTNPIPWKSLARLNSDGTLDTSFRFQGFSNLNPPWSLPTISAIVTQPDGKIIAGGPGQFFRLEADGTPDPGFNSSAVTFSYIWPGHYIGSIALQRNGQVLIGGAFNCRVGNSTVTTGLARLNPDGSLDTSFAILPDTAGVSAISSQPDGQILICGTFSQIGGVPRNGIARINGAPGMQLFAPAREGNNFQVSLPTVSGKSYSLEWSEGLTGEIWQSTPAVAGDGTIKSFGDSSANSTRRFYRIRVE